MKKNFKSAVNVLQNSFGLGGFGRPGRPHAAEKAKCRPRVEFRCSRLQLSGAWVGDGWGQRGTRCGWVGGEEPHGFRWHPERAAHSPGHVVGPCIPRPAVGGGLAVGSQS